MAALVRRLAIPICSLAVLLAVLSLSNAAPLAASDWSQIGLSQRPTWVSANAERRLRLLNSLRGIESALGTTSNAYVGTHGPGLTVGLTLTDGLYYSHGFGFRDAAKTKTPDEETVFCVGSLTKVFTGTTLLVQRDAGDVSLEDPVDQYVARIDDVACPGGGCPTVRLKHLISHSAGLPNEMEPAIVDTDTWLDELSHTKFAYFPGAFSAYSGVAAELAGLVVERVANKPYRQAVTDLLLKPLAMNQSTFELSSVPAARRSQNYDVVWNASFTGVTFTADSNWPDPLALSAAGALLSSVRDLARFDKIWLAGKAPNDVLKPATLANAHQPLLPASVGPIRADCDKTDDGQGSLYSACGNASDFGANWIVSSPGIIWHNGSTGICGSHNVLDLDHKMAVNALISTNPFPGVPDPDHHAQPGSVDAGFLYTVVNGALATASVADTTQTNWQNQRLAIGTARYLWILGAKIPATGAAAFKQSVLDQFTPAFRTAHNLTTSTVASFLNGKHAKIGACSTFRVRRAPGPNTVALRLACAKGTADTKVTWDATLKVEAGGTHRIDTITGEGASVDPY